MIRNYKIEDEVSVMTMWTKGNFKAHNFIERDYWISNFNKVKEEYLKNSKTYIYEKDKEILGFISILDNNYIGALFIKNGFERNGIGSKLINYVKDRYKKLKLNVYEKNIKAVLFYKKMGFETKKIQIDENTNEKEIIMEWNNEE